MSFLGLPEGTDPAVDIGPPPGGASRPGGLHRVRVATGHLWVFATTLASDEAHESGRPMVDAVGTVPGLGALGLRPDPALAVSLAFATTTSEPGSSEEEAVIELMETLMAAWTARELLASVGALADTEHRSS